MSLALAFEIVGCHPRPMQPALLNATPAELEWRDRRTGAHALTVNPELAGFLDRTFYVCCNMRFDDSGDATDANYLYLDGHVAALTWDEAVPDMYPDKVVLTQDGTFVE